MAIKYPDNYTKIKDNVIIDPVSGDIGIISPNGEVIHTTKELKKLIERKLGAEHLKGKNKHKIASKDGDGFLSSEDWNKFSNTADQYNLLLNYLRNIPTPLYYDGVVGDLEYSVTQNDKGIIVSIDNAFEMIHKGVHYTIPPIEVKIAVSSNDSNKTVYLSVKVDITTMQITPFVNTNLLSEAEDNSFIIHLFKIDIVYNEVFSLSNPHGESLLNPDFKINSIVENIYEKSNHDRESQLRKLHDYLITNRYKDYNHLVDDYTFYSYGIKEPKTDGSTVAYVPFNENDTDVVTGSVLNKNGKYCRSITGMSQHSAEHEGNFINLTLLRDFKLDFITKPQYEDTLIRMVDKNNTTLLNITISEYWLSVYVYNTRIFFVKIPGVTALSLTYDSTNKAFNLSIDDKLLYKQKEIKSQNITQLQIPAKGFISNVMLSNDISNMYNYTYKYPTNTVMFNKPVFGKISNGLVSKEFHVDIPCDNPKNTNSKIKVVKARADVWSNGDTITIKKNVDEYITGLYDTTMMTKIEQVEEYNDNGKTCYKIHLPRTMSLEHQLFKVLDLNSLEISVVKCTLQSGIYMFCESIRGPINVLSDNLYIMSDKDQIYIPTLTGSDKLKVAVYEDDDKILLTIHGITEKCKDGLILHYMSSYIDNYTIPTLRHVKGIIDDTDTQYLSLINNPFVSYRIKADGNIYDTQHDKINFFKGKKIDMTLMLDTLGKLFTDESDPVKRFKELGLYQMKVQFNLVSNVNNTISFGDTKMSFTKGIHHVKLNIPLSNITKTGILPIRITNTNTTTDSSECEIGIESLEYEFISESLLISNNTQPSFVHFINDDIYTDKCITLVCKGDGTFENKQLVILTTARYNGLESNLYKDKNGDIYIDFIIDKTTQLLKTSYKYD